MAQKLANAKGLYLEGIRDGNYVEAVNKYTGGHYIQHSTGVRDGKQGFIDFFQAFCQRNPIREVDILRGFSDGQYVFIHAFQSLNNGEQQWVTTDFFDTDSDDKIIEHWDVISAYQAPTPGQHSVIDGCLSVTDLDKTSHNKDIIDKLIAKAISAQVPLTSHADSFVDNYARHYPQEVFASLTRLQHQRQVLLVGQGNFVACLSQALLNDNAIAVVDLFALADGKVAEHWVNYEWVPSDEEAKNSGKF